MDIFILLIISILLYLLPENNDYLNVKSTSGLKGFFSIRDSFPSFIEICNNRGRVF